MAGGVAIAQIISLAVYPVLTRTYSVDDFGVLAVYSSTVSVVTVVSSLRYERALILPKEDQKAFDLVGLSLSLNLIVSLLLGAFVLWFPALRSLVSRSGDFSSIALYLIPGGVLLTGMYGVFTAWAVRARDYHVLGTTKVAQQTVTSGMQLLGAASHPSAFFLMMATMLGSGVGIGSITARTIKGKDLVIPTLSSMVGVARRYWRFAALSAPAALFNAMSSSAPAFLVAGLFSIASTGQYSLAMRVISVPLHLLGSSLERAFTGEATSIGRDRPGDLLRLMNRFTLRISRAAVVPALALAIAGPALFSFFFGAEWRVAGEFGRYLVLYMVANLISMPFAAVYYVYEKQGLHLLMNALKLVLAVGAFMVPYLLGWEAGAAVASYSLALMLFYLAFGFGARRILGHAISGAE